MFHVPKLQWFPLYSFKNPRSISLLILHSGPHLFHVADESKYVWSSCQDPYSFNITFTIYRRKTSDRNPEVLFKGNRTEKKSIMTFKIIDYIALLTLELRNLTNWIKKVIALTSII